MNQPDLDHFLAIPWCASLLHDPRVVFFEIKNKEHGKESFFDEILRVDGGIRARLFFRHQTPPSQVDLGPYPIQGLFMLVDVGPNLSGWPGLSHGGFISAHFDMAGGWLVQHNVMEGIQRKTLPAGSGMLTVKLEVSYLKPTRVDQTLLLTAKINWVKRNKLDIGVTLEDESRIIHSKGSLLAVSLDLHRPSMPLPDIIVCFHPQRPATQDKRPLCVIPPRAYHLLLMFIATPSLNARYEACPNPNTHCPLHKCGGDAATRRNSTCRKNHCRLTFEQRGVVGLGDGDDSRDEDGGGNVASVSAAFAALRADHVDTKVKGFDRVLWVADYVHHQDPLRMQLLNHPRRWHTHCANKQFCAAVHHNVDQLLQLAPSVIMIGLPRVAPNLRQRQVHAKREIGTNEVRLHFGNDGAQLVGRVHDATDDAEAASVGDSGD
ncbi:unnamed protein product [Clonostachys byssicola]|uniref:Thioesterase domain-containing protein n=1 Tax=Clonostachys byssicola TaxID=160290 RepID=A0A9N9XXA7_9HYPO|nr:unnamed protein product [Clonostachys byssicola]